ncbi:MAG: ATP-binding protein [Geminicoccaceae bacterium]
MSDWASVRNRLRRKARREPEPEEESVPLEDDEPVANGAASAVPAVEGMPSQAISSSESPLSPVSDQRAAVADVVATAAQDSTAIAAGASKPIAASVEAAEIADTTGTLDDVRLSDDVASAAVEMLKAEISPPASAIPDQHAHDADLEPRPSETAGADDQPLGHVISVAGSVVWGLFDRESDHPVEIGNIVRVQGGAGRGFGIVTTLRRDGRRSEDDRRLVEIKLLGEILEGTTGFQCGVSQHPALDSPIYAAEQHELLSIYSQPECSTVRLGSLKQADGLPAYAVTDQLLGKHFAILGTTGAGKSCAVTVILRAILEANPFGHVIMLDPHNEYGRAFGDRAELLNPSTLKLPYWLLNFEEISEVLVNKESVDSAYAEAAILRDAILRARKKNFGTDQNSDHITVDTPLPYRLSDLVALIKEDMGSFNRADQVASFQHLIARIERVASDRRFGFMFSSFMVQDSMGQVLSSILRLPVDKKPVTIIDLSGIPSEIVDVVVSVLCRLVFEFTLWTDRSKAPPILLVCEEAHRYVPQDDSTAFAPTKRAISRIAKEGRKYGLSLGLVTQRPAELSVSSLSQCNTIVALRMGNEHDLKFIQHAIPESSRWLTDTMPSLNTREAIVVGAGVSVPMHIRFDELPQEFRPASTTPLFSSAWQEEVVDPDLVDRTIERWRYQQRDN